jgi:hypothetical protein
LIEVFTPINPHLGTVAFGTLGETIQDGLKVTFDFGGGKIQDAFRRGSNAQVVLGEFHEKTRG